MSHLEFTAGEKDPISLSCASHSFCTSCSFVEPMSRTLLDLS